VYALCMLGFGWSPQVEEAFSIELWGQQVIDFAAQVAGASEADTAVIAGNSIGTASHQYTIILFYYDSSQLRNFGISPPRTSG